MPMAGRDSGEGERYMCGGVKEVLTKGERIERRRRNQAISTLKLRRPDKMAF